MVEWVKLKIKNVGVGLWIGSEEERMKEKERRRTKKKNVGVGLWIGSEEERKKKCWSGSVDWV